MMVSESFFQAENRRLRMHINERYADVEEKDGKGDAVGIAAENADDISDQAGEEAE